MKKKTLIITVGGSHKPIIRSIELNGPDFVYFICSDDSGNNKGSYTTVTGEGNVCGGNPRLNKPHTEKNIVVQTQLEAEQYEILKVVNFDNINDCFDVSYNIIHDITTDRNENQIIIDYTGGTKSMSSGLVLAASNYPDIIISLVAGDRNNLVKTIDGTEQLSLLRVNKAYLSHYISKAESLMQKRDYDSVKHTIENLLSSYYDIPTDIKNKLQSYISEAKALGYWDKFQHIAAYKAFYSKELKEKYKTYLDGLRKILISRAKMDKDFDITETGLKATMPVSGYEPVFDLILNAERREFNHYLDDAVARIYRALEVFIQVYLKQNFDISTNDVDLEKIPECELKGKLKQPEPEESKIKIGLVQSYELLGCLDREDPVFLKFEKNRNHLLRVLSSRNYSILAHGFQSIDVLTYKEIKAYAITDFLLPLIRPYFEEDRFSLSQLPNQF